MTGDDLLADFAENPVAAAQRWAQPVVDRRVGQVEGELQQLRISLAQDRVHRALDADPVLRDRWRLLNEDPAFLGWLNEIDQLSGTRRIELLRQAYDLGAAARVGHFFKSYLAARTPARQRTPETAQLAGARQPQITEQHITRRPGERPRMWRRAEIARFYEDVRRGLYRDRGVERLRIENEIAAAARERRIADPPFQHSKFVG